MGNANVLVELSGVLVNTNDSNGSAVDGRAVPDSEVVNAHRCTISIENL